MYGYDLPRYMREYQAEWRRFDRFLRVRRSLDNPGAFVLERKTRYLIERPFVYNTDRQVKLKDDYQQVLVFWPREVNRVYDFLRRFDIQRVGAKQMADELDARDDYERARAEADRISEFEAKGSEAYDFLAWREGRRVAT